MDHLRTASEESEPRVRVGLYPRLGVMIVAGVLAPRRRYPAGRINNWAERVGRWSQRHALPDAAAYHSA